MVAEAGSDSPKMKLESIGRFFISLILVILYFFLFGLASIQRLWARDISIARNEESPENITSPAITIETIDEKFNGEHDCSNQSFTLEEFKGCISMSNIAFKLDKMHFDMDWGSIYHVIVPEEGSIKFTDGGTFTLQLKQNKTYFVSFYDQNFMFRSNNPEVVPKNGILVKSNAYAFIYIKAIRHKRMNTEKNSCEEDPTYSYQNCIIQKLVSRNQCKPYWLENIDHEKICSNVSEMGRYFTTLQALKTKDEETIFETYKCKKPCTYMEYKIDGPPQAQTQYPLTALLLMFSSKKVIIEKEEAAYSSTSFVADCGGLLGLFVGFNFLLLWDLFIEIYQRFEKLIN